jgi:DnaJ-class molecular chaperone
MDYYSTLGVNKNASQDEIKKAYKKMSMQHHPDRTGGDDSKFKEINEAYQTLNDPQKKQMYDQFGTADPRQRQYNSQNFEFNFNGSPFSGGMDDIFEQMFGGGSPFGNRQRSNRPIQVAVDVTLEDVLNGKTIGMEIALPTGRTKVVTVDVPSGVEHGQTIRYRGMGEQNNPNLPAGDLLIQIRVRNHPSFQRFGDNILCETKVSAWDLMLGSKTLVKTLDGKNIEINIPAGTQPDTVLSCKGEGLPNMRNKVRGNLQIKIKAEIPRYNEQQRQQIKNLKDGI